MANGRALSRPGTYRIRIKGLLDDKWSRCFDGLAVTPQPDGETLLSGTITDQAALHGVLAKIRDLGLPLLLVQRLEDKDARQIREGGEGGT
jgi:hypothetical protein